MSCPLAGQGQAQAPRMFTLDPFAVIVIITVEKAVAVLGGEPFILPYMVAEPVRFGAQVPNQVGDLNRYFFPA